MYHPTLTWQGLLLVMSCLGLSGCVLLTPTVPYASAERPPVSSEQRTGGTRAPASITNELTLASALALALTNNPGIAGRRYEVDAATAQQDRAFGELLPKAELRGSYMHYREDQIINPRRPGMVDTILFSDQQLGGDVILRMPLFAGGRLISGIRAAKLARLSALQSLAHSREELVFNVSSVYYGILAQKQIIHSVAFSHTVLSNHLTHVREMIKAQKAAKVDQLRTEVRLADLKQRLAVENNRLAIQTRILLNFLGAHTQSDALPLIIGDFPEPLKKLPASEQAVNEALQQRNDYLAARFALQAQAKRVDVARAAHAPSLFLEGNYGNRWDAHDTERNNEVGGLGVALSFPLFEGGIIEATVRRERAVLGAMEAKVREKELLVRLEVETAILNLAASLERLDALEKSIEQATESLRIQRDKYAQSKGSITDVLDAQAELLTTQMNYYRAQADHSIATAQFQFASGRAN